MREPTSEDIAAAAPQSSGDLQHKASYLPDIHRLLPQAPDAEQGVLSSFLLAPNEVYGLCMEKYLRAEHFHIPAHALIYSNLCAMSFDKLPIDIITLTARLRNQNQLDQCGGPAFVTQLFTFLPTAANAAFYVEIVFEKATLRQIINVCTEYAARSYEEQHEVQTLLDECETKIMAIRAAREIGAEKSFKELTMGAISLIDQAYEKRGAISGLSTGFADLDRVTDGMHPGEMIVIAARPSMGKTALAMNIVEHVAITLKLPVAVFSLEMGGEQLALRMLCSQARVSTRAIRDGFLSDRDFPAITAAANRMSTAPIFVNDSCDMAIQEIRAKARRLKADKKIELIVIDYLQLVRSTTRRAADSRQVEVAEVSLGSKQMAKELGIPVVVLAQILRVADTRRPRISDLKESGAIEQDADVIGLLVREEMYAENEEDKKAAEGKATLIIGKQRSGPIADVPLTFLKEFTRFETRARDYDDEEPQQDLL